MPTPVRLTPAPTAGAADVDAAQTAAAIENLTIAVYAQLAQLPFVLTLTPPASTTFAAFVARTVQQHTDHLTAFNAAAMRLGGRAQRAPDQALTTAVVHPGLAAITSPAEVVAFAAQLELIAAETYAAQTATVADRQLRGSFASISGVEVQHRAVLLAFASLLGGDPALMTFPLDAALLPAAAVSAATPSAFLRTDQARPATEGALP